MGIAPLRRLAWILAAVTIPAVQGLAASAVPAPGTATSVSIVDFAFVPSSVSINVGETVDWTNMGGFEHTATADGGTFGSPLLGPGQTYSFTFSAAGTYGYHCTVHPFMQGTITVTDGSTPTPTATPTLTATPTNTPTPISELCLMIFPERCFQVAPGLGPGSSPAISATVGPIRSR